MHAVLSQTNERGQLECDPRIEEAYRGFYEIFNAPFNSPWARPFQRAVVSLPLLVFRLLDLREKPALQIFGSLFDLDR